MRWALHRIAAWFTTVPFLVIVCTGALLQIKAYLPWIQPQFAPSHSLEASGEVSLPSTQLSHFLSAAQSVPAAQVSKWKDIRVIDIRPEKGVARIRAHSGFEITVDLQTGKVLGAAPRRTDFLIRLHEGSLFGKGIKYLVFFPVTLGLLVLWGTGITLLLRKKNQGLKSKRRASYKKRRWGNR